LLAPLPRPIRRIWSFMKMHSPCAWRRWNCPRALSRKRVKATNPQSVRYDGRMADLDHICIYTWDARPYPAFPQYDQVWGDAPNWPFGHWIGGKLSTYTPLQELDSMPIATTYAPRHPYIVDPATGKLDKQYRDFFEGIEFIQGDPIASVPLQPAPEEAASAINSLLAVLRSQKRLSS